MENNMSPSKLKHINYLFQILIDIVVNAFRTNFHLYLEIPERFVKCWNINTGKYVSESTNVHVGLLQAIQNINENVLRLPMQSNVLISVLVVFILIRGHVLCCLFLKRSQCSAGEAEHNVENGGCMPRRGQQTNTFPRDVCPAAQ